MRPATVELAVELLAKDLDNSACAALENGVSLEQLEEQLNLQVAAVRGLMQELNTARQQA